MNERARELIDITHPRQVDDGTFVAEAPDWFGERVFGGIIVAQALNAAIQTVEDRPLPHSIHGYFLRPARPDAQIHFRLQRLRDGRALRTRQATVSQNANPIFIMACSFHADEDGDEYQLAMPADIPAPEDLPATADPGPFDVREVGPTPPGPDGTRASTRRAWFRLDDRLPDDPIVHATLLAFVSDMTGTAFRPLSLDQWGTHTDASIDHALWFHRPARADEWLFYDLHTLVCSGARSVVRGSMYDRDGKLCLSMAQEVLIRPLEGLE